MSIDYTWRTDLENRNFKTDTKAYAFISRHIKRNETLYPTCPLCWRSDYKARDLQVMYKPGITGGYVQRELVAVLDTAGGVDTAVGVASLLVLRLMPQTESDWSFKDSLDCSIHSLRGARQSSHLLRCYFSRLRTLLAQTLKLWSAFRAHALFFFLSSLDEC